MTFFSVNPSSGTHAVGMALAMITVSALLAKFIYVILEKSICRLIASQQDLLTKSDLERIAFLLCMLIPVAALSTAQNLITLPQHISTWITALIQSASQLILALVVFNVIGTTLQSWLNKQVENLWESNPQLAEQHEESLKSRGNLTYTFLKIFTFFLPASTCLILLGHAPQGLWAGTAILLIAIIVTSINVVSRTKEIMAKADGKKRQNTTVITDDCSQASDPGAKERLTIAELFLELYKFQLGDPKAKTGKISILGNATGDKGTVYELQVQINGDWKSRRMTIGPLGSETGSRSKCYFVIYDEYVVIKVPPKKVTRLEDYLRMLRKEKSIVDQINMKECIIPTISAQLKNIRTHIIDSGISSLNNEEDYIRLFTISASLRKYLQIDGQFAFFMDLSQYFFLQHAVLSMHAINEIVPEEISKHSEIAWDIVEFENRYGIEIVPLLMTLKKAYTEFENHCKKLLRSHQVQTLPSSFQIRRWFFNELAEKDIVWGGSMPDNVARDITMLLKKIMNQHRAHVARYREAVKSSVFKTEFYRNKTAMEGICANLLNLLAHLKKTGVAMRDLKPDNLLVAGDKDQYPGFLLTPDKYKIGLIDVETAVIFANKKKIAQPQMGGTPQYATPSHFFKNEVLEEVLGDLPLTLHFQDWHATIAIIYKIVTGGILFEQTVHAIPLVIDGIRKALAHQTSLSTTFMQMSGLFWERAAREFAEKLINREDLLRAAIIDIPPDAAYFLRTHVRNDLVTVQENLQKIINAQTFWPDPAKRNMLAKCSPEKIQKFIQQARQATNSRGGQHQPMVIFLERLETRKLTLRDNKQKYILLNGQEAKLSVFELLEIMFHIVHRHMCRDEWKPRRQDKQYFNTAPNGNGSSLKGTETTKTEYLGE